MATLLDGNSGTSPHLSASASPLSALAMRALQLYGELSPGSVSGTSLQLFIEYANEVIDDILSHPYIEKNFVLPYYVSLEESRPIPDHIVRAGILARYATGKGSKRAAEYVSTYFRVLNTTMARIKFGVGASFELQAVDYPDGGVL